MTNLNQQLQEIKQRAATHATDSRVLFEQIVRTGKGVRGLPGGDTIEYRLEDDATGKWWATIDHMHGERLASRATYGSPAFIACARWLLKSLDSVWHVSEDRIISRGADLYLCECPYCGQTCSEHAHIEKWMFHPGHKITWHWEHCPHFFDAKLLGEVRYGIFIADRADFVTCENCAELTTDGRTCVHCGRRPVVETRCGGDA